jgi:hypothetical protein
MMVVWIARLLCAYFFSGALAAITWGNSESLSVSSLSPGCDGPQAPRTTADGCRDVGLAEVLVAQRGRCGWP